MWQKYSISTTKGQRLETYATHLNSMYKVCSRSLSLGSRHLCRSCQWASTKRSIMMILVSTYRQVNSSGGSQPTVATVSIEGSQNRMLKQQIKTMEQIKPITIFSSFSSLENKIASNKKPRRFKINCRLPK